MYSADCAVVRCSSVRPSVRLSLSCIVSKLVKIFSNLFSPSARPTYHSSFSTSHFITTFGQGTPNGGVEHRWRMKKIVIFDHYLSISKMVKDTVLSKAVCWNRVMQCINYQTISQSQVCDRCEFKSGFINTFWRRSPVFAARRSIAAVVWQLRSWVALWLSGRASDLRSRSRGFEDRPWRCCVTTLGKLFTPYCLCHQAV